MIAYADYVCTPGLFPFLKKSLASRQFRKSDAASPHHVPLFWVQRLGIILTLLRTIEEKTLWVFTKRWRATDGRGSENITGGLLERSKCPVRPEPAPKDRDQGEDQFEHYISHKPGLAMTHDLGGHRARVEGKDAYVAEERVLVEAALKLVTTYWPFC